MMRKVVRWSPGGIVGFPAFVVHACVTGPRVRLNREHHVLGAGGTTASREPTSENQ